MVEDVVDMPTILDAILTQVYVLLLLRLLKTWTSFFCLEKELDTYVVGDMYGKRYVSVPSSFHCSFVVVHVCIPRKLKFYMKTTFDITFHDLLIR